MNKPFQAMPDIAILPAHYKIPGIGFLPINAFVIKAKEPVLVDTGMSMDSADFMKALQSVIDPRDLKWIWLTHDDADHIGSLQKVLEAAPDARLVSNSLSVLRIRTVWPLPLDRARWLNPGESIHVGDRTLTAVRPPLFDNPATIGVYEDKSEAFFSADCFGAIIPSPARRTDDITEEDLVQGMTGWAGLDNPWIHMVKPDAFNQTLDRVRQLGPKMIFSSHLPMATGKTEQFLEVLAGVPSSTPSVAPNQAMLDQILAQMGGQGQTP